MKLRILSAIAAIAIVIMTSVGVFIEKLDVNPGHRPASISAVITNIVSNPQILYPKERFSINGTIYNPNPYTINFDTDSISATFDKNIITIHYPGCSNVVESRVIRPHQSVEFALPPGCEAYFVNSTGTSNAIIGITYVAFGSTHTVMTSKNFTISQPLENRTGLTLEEQLGLSSPKINSPTKTTIFDTGIYPFFINVTNTDFVVHYNMSGGQVKSAILDMPSKSLILSVTTTGNGTLVIDLPRALIDPKIEGQDSAFIVLDDGQEVLPKQIATTGTDRVLSIPFQYGVSQIQIIAPVPIQ